VRLRAGGAIVSIVATASACMVVSQHQWWLLPVDVYACTVGMIIWARHA
jgi:hypothetical protein